jgi:hypothetical protein
MFGGIIEEISLFRRTILFCTGRLIRCFGMLSFNQMRISNDMAIGYGEEQFSMLEREVEEYMNEE